MIPDTEEKPRRGFTTVQYIVENKERIESDEFPMLSASDSISILQDQYDKSKFYCFLSDFKAKFNTKLELIRSVVERLEHTVAETGKARVEASIHYFPQIIRDSKE